jgi:hypothetical protein
MPARQDPAPRQVVAWGRSVLVSALAAGLARSSGLEVVQIEATLPAALAALQHGPAHTVLCDLASVPAAYVVALLAAHPQLVVVIVDADAQRAWTMTCRRSPMRTIDDLVAAMTEAPAKADPDVSAHGPPARDCPPPVPPCPTAGSDASSPEAGSGEDSG